MDQPTALTFLMSGGPGDGVFQTSFDVVDEEGQIISATGKQPFAASLASPTILTSSFLLTFGHGGRFAVRCIVEGQEHFRAYFDVGQGVSVDPT